MNQIENDVQVYTKNMYMYRDRHQEYVYKIMKHVIQKAHGIIEYR